MRFMVMASSRLMDAQSNKRSVENKSEAQQRRNAPGTRCWGRMVETRGICTPELRTRRGPDLAPSKVNPAHDLDGGNLPRRWQSATLRAVPVRHSRTEQRPPLGFARRGCAGILSSCPLGRLAYNLLVALQGSAIERSPRFIIRCKRCYALAVAGGKLVSAGGPMAFQAGRLIDDGMRQISVI